MGSLDYSHAPGLLRDPFLCMNMARCSSLRLTLRLIKRMTRPVGCLVGYAMLFLQHIDPLARDPRGVVCEWMIVNLCVCLRANQVSDLPVIDPQACADYYGSIIYSGIMCIDSAGGKGVCNGDSGGTLNIRQSEGGNKWTQVGVTSFVSSAGCESGNPHGFSRVAEHLEWIETVTGLSLI